MARRAIVTRTVVGTEVTTMCVDTVSAEVSNKTYVLSGTFADDAKLLKAVQKAYDNDTTKNVAIVSKKDSNKIYGMWEEDFIANAMELDENRKPIGQADAEVAEVTEQ